LANARLGDFFAIAIAQHGFQHDADRDGQFRDWAEAGFFQLRQRVEGTLFAVSEVKGLQRVKLVLCLIHKIHRAVIYADRRKAER
jgi:hypothetical protein